MSIERESFLGLLLEKLSDIQRIEDEVNKSGERVVDFSPLKEETYRQIRQALQGGDPIKGTGVTKSGEED